MKKIFLLIFFLSTIFSQEQYPSSCPSNEWIQIPEEQRRIMSDFNDATLKFWTDAYPESGWDKKSINTTIENIKNIVLLIEKYDNLKPSIVKDPNFDIKVFEEERERMILFFLNYFLISVEHLREEEYKYKNKLYDQFPERRQLQLTQLDIRILALVEGYYNKLEERASKSIINEGKYVNHCNKSYNSNILTNDFHTFPLIATKNIKKNTEIIANYNHIHKHIPFIAGSKKHFLKC